MAALVLCSLTGWYFLVASNNRAASSYLLPTPENHGDANSRASSSWKQSRNKPAKETLVHQADEIREDSSSGSRSLGTFHRLSMNVKDSDHDRHSPPQPEQEGPFAGVECTIQEYVHDNATRATGAGSQRPTVLRSIWTTPDKNWNHEDTFLQHYGHVPYYIKDRFVQVHGDHCIAQFQDLWAYIRSSTDNSTRPILQNHRRSLLAFTNDLENPALFGEDRTRLGYAVPDLVQHVNSFAILSTMTRGQSHEFHKHGESWIAQAAGHKVWYFLPPTVERPTKVNACGYLDGTVTPPPGITTCTQSPGDVIWFPKDWYHATCSLSEWNIAIGAQQGVRLRQEFKTLPLTVDNSHEKRVQELLRVCSRESQIS